MSRRISISALGLAVLVAIGACAGGEADPRDPDRTPKVVASPQPSPTARGLCQPFPDRLIDDLLSAYNGRNLEGLETLVKASDVVDIVAAAYADESSFDDVETWAQANWDVGDRMKNVGYGAFHPTKEGFQMMLTRSSAMLRQHGIARVSVALNAISAGCTIESLETSGPVQAEGEPCAFYDAFEHVSDISSTEPRECVDGSADHARSDAIATAAGERIVVWGGHRGGHFTFGDIAMDGLSFDPASRRWMSIEPPDLPAFRPEVGVWTGTEVIVIGGASRRPYRVLGAAYDPRARSWRPIDVPMRWGGFEGAWTGRELLLWGGPSQSEDPRRDGFLYDPAADTWRKTSPAPISGRWSHSVVWTGSELIVWGGGNARSDLAEGAAYNPATDAWRRLPPAPLSPRQWMPLTWTGNEVIVWGGSSVSRNVANGAAYSPATNAWRKLPPAPLRGRHYHSAVWTGSEMIVFGGYNYRRSFADGAAYDPVRDNWRKLPRAPIKPRFVHAAVWTGDRMFIFGGTWDFGHIALGDGALYDPVSDTWRRVVPRVGTTGTD